MANKKVLIVDDDSNICELLRLYLEKDGFDTIIANDGESAIVKFNLEEPDLILLDIMLPKLDGWQVCRAIRKNSDVPIIMITAKGETFDKILGLDLGADDYVTKPFGTSELLARIRGTLRHWAARKDTSVETLGIFRTGELIIDFGKRRVTVRGEEVHLTQNEFRIVSLLSANAGKVLTYDFILKELWGPAAKGDNQALRVHMANIRRKLEKNPAEPQYIFTEVGVGYRMTEGD